MQSVIACDGQLKASKKIAILTHQNPDADALCSAVALKHIILDNYSNNAIIDIFAENSGLDDVYLPIVKNENINNQSCTTYDFAIALDSPNVARFGIYENIFHTAKHTVNIDHHLTNEKFAENNLVFKSSSTCEALYLMFSILNKTLSDAVCRLVYAGIITDTNNLTLGNVNVRTYKILQELTERQIDLHAVADHFMKNNSLSKTYLLERALQSLTLMVDNKVAVMKLFKGDFKDTNSTQADALGIVNHAINIAGVQIALILIKQDDNSYYCSLRSKNGIDVAHIATSFGGGGHEDMAGFTYTGLLVDLKPKFIKACTEVLSNIEEFDKTENLFFSDETTSNNK